MGEFHDEQPKDGDTVIHCGHPDSTRNHFFKTGTPMKFTRPNGTSGFACWVIVCDSCFHQAGGRADLIEIRGDAVWEGNAPVIKASN